VQFSDRTGRHHLLGLERFADHSGREAWDYSAWVRVYSSYLDERLVAFRCGARRAVQAFCLMGWAWQRMPAQPSLQLCSVVRYWPCAHVCVAARHCHHPTAIQDCDARSACMAALIPQSSSTVCGAPRANVFVCRLAFFCRNMCFDPEGNTKATGAGNGALGPAAGATGNPYLQNGAAAYGGPPTGSPGANGYGAAYGGPTGAAYGGSTGAPFGGPTGAYPGAAAMATGHGPRAANPIKLKDCSTVELLQHLPTIQKLLGRLMQCVPEGASAVNPIILVRLRQFRCVSLYVCHSRVPAAAWEMAMCCICMHVLQFSCLPSSKLLWICGGTAADVGTCSCCPAFAAADVVLVGSQGESSCVQGCL